MLYMHGETQTFWTRLTLNGGRFHYEDTGEVDRDLARRVQAKIRRNILDHLEQADVPGAAPTLRYVAHADQSHTWRRWLQRKAAGLDPISTVMATWQAVKT